MVNACKRYLVENAKAWGLPRNAKWDSLVYNNYYPHITNIVLIWFCGREHYPRAITKRFRGSEIPKREFHILAEVSALSKCAPKPLHFGKHGPFWAVWIQGLHDGRRGFATWMCRIIGRYFEGPEQWARAFLSA